MRALAVERDAFRVGSDLGAAESVRPYAAAQLGHRSGWILQRQGGKAGEPVGRLVNDGGFDIAQNRAVTWRHLLQNTSEWEGELFGKSDLIDRNRQLSVEGRGKAMVDDKVAAEAEFAAMVVET